MRKLRHFDNKERPCGTTYARRLKIAEDRFWGLMAVLALLVALANIARGQTSAPAKPIIDTVQAICLKDGNTLEACAMVPQSMPTTATPATAKAAQATPTPALNSFLMAGAIANVSTAPKPGGFVAYGTPIASDKESFSMYMGGIARVSGKLQTTTAATTGVAQRVCKMAIGHVDVSCWLIGMLGPGQTGPVTSLALDAGGGVLLEHMSVKWTGLMVWIGGLQSKVAAAVQTQAMVALGYSWGK